jgi:hypothetical protein
LHAGAVNAADIVHPIDELAAALVDVGVKRLSQITRGDLKMLLTLRRRGRGNRNGTDSSDKDCRGEVSEHSCLPDIQSFLLPP